MAETHITIRIIPKAGGFSVPKVAGITGVDLTEAYTIEGARHIAGLIESKAKAKGYKTTTIEEGR